MFRARCVPNMYLFGTFSAQNPPKIAPSPPPSRAHFRALAGCGNGSPGFAHRARGMAGLEEYGHLAARDATEGAGVAKKRHFARASAGTFLLRLGLVVKTAPGSAVTGP